MIDDNDEVSATVFIRIPHTTLQQQDAKHCEITLIHQHHTHLQLLTIAASINNKKTLNIHIKRRYTNTHRYRKDIKNGCDLLPDLLNIHDTHFTRLKTAPLNQILNIQRDTKLHDINWIVTKKHLRKPKKATNNN